MPYSPSSSPGSAFEPIIRVRGLETRIGGRVIHRDLDLDVSPGEVMAVVGASGAGKSVLLRTIIGLQAPVAGSIEVLGRDVTRLDARGRREMDAQWGVLFQDGALFSSLTLAENIAVPLREQLDLPGALRDEICMLKLGLVGLPPDAAGKFPSELSGGMRKRAGLARALALEPRIVFLDEPTAGLDPLAAEEFDQLVGDLKESLGLTVFMVTHDLDSLVAVADRIAVLIDNRLKIGTMAQLLEDPDPWIHAYFGGRRGRAARAAGSGSG